MAQEIRHQHTLDEAAKRRILDALAQGFSQKFVARGHGISIWRVIQISKSGFSRREIQKRTEA
jgi:hypothetical protein